MPVRNVVAIVAMAVMLLVGCGREEPLQALESAARTLQESIESKDTSALMDLLHPDFRASGQFDREWARRMAALTFLRHRNVRALVLGSEHELDPSYAARGHSQAQVTLTGAEGLLPQRAGHYRVRLEWWHEDGKWLLARLEWD